MRTFDLTPFHRSTIGFDRLFDTLDNAVSPDWPPYNIEKKGENAYSITMALAGYGPEDIELTQHGAELAVVGRTPVEQDKRQFLHQGLVMGSFKQTFKLANHVRIAGARLENGLLSIELVHELPEQLKPRKIEIVSASSDTPRKAGGTQIEHAAKEQRSAA